MGALIVILPLRQAGPPESRPGLDFYLERFETTSGIAIGRATPDGRPLLWKSRDRSSDAQQDMEYHYVDDGRIPFISMTDRGEADEYYGGVNAAGFAIENTDAHNRPDTVSNPASNGWEQGGDLDDGETMYYALATCRTVDDFERLLDSLNEGGRTYNYNYGVIDAFGGAAIFEAWGHHYVRYDAGDSPYGFLIRSNYAYSGRDPSGEDLLYGLNRHDRAWESFKRGVDENRLTPEFIFREVVRNLRLRDLDPYPLPFDGYYEGFPYGTLPNVTAVCRSRTRVVMVVQGVPRGGNPYDATLWAMAGHPLGSVATPLWVRAGNVPPEYDADSSRLCNLAKRLKDWIYVSTPQGPAVDTWKLHDPLGRGWWDYSLRLEEWVFRKTEAFLRDRRFNYDMLSAFQAQVARQVADSLDAWHPYQPVDDLEADAPEGGRIRVAWGELERDAFGRPVRSVQYEVYAADHPFRGEDLGTRIATGVNPALTDTLAREGGRFYRVLARSEIGT